MRSRRNARYGIWVAATALGALALAACGGSSGGTDSGAAGSTSRSATTGSTHTGPMGTYLTDGSGKTLYQFALDTGSTSMCTGSCVSFWPPLLTTGDPTAGSGATSGQLGTTKRSDGSMQVTYGGHPVYHYVKD